MHEFVRYPDCWSPLLFSSSAKFSEFWENQHRTRPSEVENSKFQYFLYAILNVNFDRITSISMPVCSMDTDPDSFPVIHVIGCMRIPIQKSKTLTCLKFQVTATLKSDFWAKIFYFCNALPRISVSKYVSYIK